MSDDQSEEAGLRVAIIGSGPSGFYAAGQLIAELGDGVEVDMYDRLPTPFGLVRAGVAPDHPKIKSVTRVYEKVAANPNFRFFGNVEFGTHIERHELEPGDLVFFNTLRRPYSHVGIYLGDNRFIHAPKPGAVVRTENMRVAYWQQRYDGARRIVE